MDTPTEPAKGAKNTPRLPSSPDNQLIKIPLTKLDANPFQGRRAMDPTKLKELASNIARHGLLQPITARPVGDRFQIIGGHRRVAAIQRLRDEAQAAGDTTAWTTVDASVRKTATDFEMALLMLVENNQRDEMDEVDQADSMARLMALNASIKTAKDLAAIVDASADRVRRLLQLAKAAPIVREAVREGLLVSTPTSSDAHGDGAEAPKERREQRRLDLTSALEFERMHQHIASEKNDTKYDMRKVADARVTKAMERALRENWTVRKVAAYVDELLSGKATRAKKDPSPAVNAFTRDGTRLVIFPSRLEASTAEEKRALKTALEPVLKAIEAT